MGDILRMTGPAIYFVGAAVVGAKLLAAGVAEAWRWLRKNPPRSVVGGVAILFMTPPVAIMLLVGTATLMAFWPIVAMFTLQRRQQRERLARMEDAEREAELFREVREASAP